MITTLRRGVTEVHVPDNARLRRLRAQQSELRERANRLKQECGQINAQAQRLSTKSNSIADLESFSKEKAKLKQQFFSLERQAQAAEEQLKRVDLEYKSWMNNFGGWEARKQQLTEMLADAPDSDAPPVDIIIDTGATRSKQQIRFELQKLDSFINGFGQ